VHRVISLFGIAIVQTHLYYHNFSKDWPFQKILVRICRNSNAKHFLISYSASGGGSHVCIVFQGSWGSMTSISRVLATLDLIFMLHAVYFYLVVNFGNLVALETIVWYVCSVTDATMGFRYPLLNRSFKVMHLTSYSVRSLILVNEPPGATHYQCTFLLNSKRNSNLTFAGF